MNVLNVKNKFKNKNLQIPKNYFLLSRPSLHLALGNPSAVGMQLYPNEALFFRPNVSYTCFYIMQARAI